jgi:hypothetical protein
LLDTRAPRSMSHMQRLPQEGSAMCLERTALKFGFATAAVAIVSALGWAIEYVPLFGALAR